MGLGFVVAVVVVLLRWGGVDLGRAVGVVGSDLWFWVPEFLFLFYF